MPYSILAEVEAPVFVLDSESVNNLTPSVPVTLSPDRDRNSPHFLSQLLMFLSCSKPQRLTSVLARFHPTPAIIVYSCGVKAKELGVLNTYVNSPSLYAWFSTEDVRIQAWVKAVTVVKLPDEVPQLLLRIRISGPSEKLDDYKSRMLWALSPTDRRPLEARNSPQEPPPSWQFTCLRDFRLNTTTTADAAQVRPLHGLLDKYAPSLSMYPSTIRGINVKLFDHQLQGVQWCINQENPPPIPTSDLTSCVQMLTTGQGGHIYHSMLGSFLRQPVTLGRGGLVADEMGLGKTLMMLALIQVLKNAALPPGFIKTTLIIAPVSVLSVWQQEIQDHCTGLEFMVYYSPGNRKQRVIPDFSQYDVVISNYHTLARDDRPFLKTPWRRVILDEGHNIRTAPTWQEAATELNAHARWVLTGTPIVNDLHDLRSLVAFLRLCPPIYEDRFWAQCIGSGSGLLPTAKLRKQNVKELLENICLYRTKDMIGPRNRKLVDLPPVSYATVRVPIYPLQRTIYNRTVSSAKQQFGTSQTVGNKARFQVFALISQLRQIAIHADLAGEVEGARAPVILEDEDITSYGLYSATSIMGDELLMDLPGEQPAASSSKNISAKRSAKLDVIVSFLHAVPDGEKTLIFSNFVQFLEIAKSRLTAEGIPSEIFTGDLKEQERSANVKRFCDGDPSSDPKAPRVMLVSIQAGGTGLNLTAANHVIIVDPWWQPSTERQAIDRVNRIGQTRPVEVLRLVATDTIEEKSLSENLIPTVIPEADDAPTNEDLLSFL
ncbi:SNF2 family N-terminal domain-containing protein [Roridomyces roridus]|uniref:SNF2 family N-terminal domain-containing protein n=1 Tax=Roridomyces roridus TaxID=1738132 RepID=A0AAD7C5I1_9AGAR|nr:SNF2 family N-terminal domain-containing protein [Roridomyces roridus]